MGLMDKIKKIAGGNEYDNNDYDDDGYYDDLGDDSYDADPQEQPQNIPQQPVQPTPPPQMGGYSSSSSINSGINLGGPALQMKVVRPESFASVSQIADHLLSQRTVVLNLEATNKETARRLIDFLSGVAYSIDGQLKRIANNAYVITPSNVDVSGDQLREQRKNAQSQQPEEPNDPYSY